MEKNNTCDGKCLKCDFCKIVPDPDKYDSFNFDDLAVYCTNPNNRAYRSRQTKSFNGKSTDPLLCE